MIVERATERTNRGAITLCVILATLMQALDTTIANVGCPTCKAVSRRAKIRSIGC